MTKHLMLATATLLFTLPAFADDAPRTCSSARFSSVPAAHGAMGRRSCSREGGCGLEQKLIALEAGYPKENAYHNAIHAADGAPLVDGYAPFCKHSPPKTLNDQTTTSLQSSLSQLHSC